MLAQDPRNGRWASPPWEDHLPEKDRFAVLFKVFTTDQMEALENTIGRTRAKKLGTFNKKLMARGVMDMRNLKRKVLDAAGNPVFDDDGNAKVEDVPFTGIDTIDLCRPRVRRWMQQELLDLNELDEDDEGN